MKKIFIAIGVIVILAVVGIGIFIATFNINRYKDLFIAQIEALTGNKATIGKLSLEWKGSVILGIDDFAIYNEEAAQRVNLLSFERAAANVEIAPLLTGRIQLSSLSMERPNIHIIRMKDAKVAVRGYEQKPPQAVQESGKSQAQTSSAFSIDISAVRINDGTVRFQDMMSEPGVDITIRKIDAEIKDISMAGPVYFNVKMAAASPRQNITFEGVAGGFDSGEIFMRDLIYEADLASINHAELLKAFPIAEKMEVGPGLAGIFKAKVRELKISGNKVVNLSADIALSGGRVELASLRAPVESINLTASAEETTLTVKAFSASLASGVLAGKGRFEDIFTTPRTSLEMTAEIRGIKSFISEVFAKTQGMDGNARLTFNGTMTGITWPEISKTLAGNGEFYLDRGVMVGKNVLNQTLNALTLFPGMAKMVRGYVPAPIQQSFDENSTVIEPLRQSYTIESGYVLLPKVDVRTSTFDMIGSAKSSLTGDYSGSGMIRFTKSVSRAMVQAVPEMSAIEDAEGRIEIPMAFKGGEDNFKVIPDLKYVGQKVAVQKAGEVVADYLKQVTDSGAAQSSAEAGAAPKTKAPKLKDIMKSLLEESKK